MTDLATWLAAQLDADEQTARAAIAEHERAVREYHDANRKHYDDYQPLDGETAADWSGGTNEEENGDYWCAVWAGEGIARIARLDNEYDTDTAEHIARHDPAFILADIAAKRRIIERYRRAVVEDDTEEDWDCAGQAAYALAALEQVLRLLALPYAGRPGYDPSWAPEQPARTAGGAP